jgi:2-isopropylmalate synthase
VADQTGLEITSEGIHEIFSREYLEQTAPYAYSSHKMQEDTTSDEPVQIDIALSHRGASMALQGGGNGPIDAFVDALGLDIKLMDYHEHSIGSGANAKAACYVELRLENGPTLFGAGIDSNIVTASFKAVLSAVNRQIKQKEAAAAPAAAGADATA